jgi:hypothetical protein
MDVGGSIMHRLRPSVCVILMAVQLLAPESSRSAPNDHSAPSSSPAPRAEWTGGSSLKDRSPIAAARRKGRWVAKYLRVIVHATTGGDVFLLVPHISGGPLSLDHHGPSFEARSASDFAAQIAYLSKRDGIEISPGNPAYYTVSGGTLRWLTEDEAQLLRRLVKTRTR